MAQEQSGSEGGGGAAEGAPRVAAFAESSFSREDSKGQVVNFQVPALLALQPAGLLTSFAQTLTHSSLQEARTRRLYRETLA